MSRFFVLDVPEDELIASVAEEGAFTDADLDALELALDREVDPALVTSLALKLARAGRAISSGALADARRRLLKEGRSTEAEVVELAESLLLGSPSLKRAESGYVLSRPNREPLFVEDPVAAYWHRRMRLGPPIRRDPGSAPFVLEGPGIVERAAQLLGRGDIIAIGFLPEGLIKRIAPPSLYLHASGFARTPSFASGVRWSELASVGRIGADGPIAYVQKGSEPIQLPRRPRVPVAELLSIIERAFGRAVTSR